MAEKGKKLTLAEINKLDKDFQERKTIWVANGQYKLEIDIKIRKSKIQELILDFQDMIDQLRKNNASQEVFQDLMFLNYMLIIKHFTNLKLPSEVDKMIVVCKKLLDTDILDEIMANFDQKELKKIETALYEYSKQTPRVSNTIGELLFDKLSGVDVNEEEEY